VRRRYWIGLVACGAAAALILAWVLPSHHVDNKPNAAPASISYSKLYQPFRGVKLFKPQTQATEWEASQGAKGRWIAPLTDEPQAVWLIDPQDLVKKVPLLAAQSEREHRRLVLVTYYIPNLNCSGYKSGAPITADYQRWINRLIKALSIDHSHAVIVLEPDSVALSCFNQARAHLLKWATIRLEQAGQYVYLDAGHPGWLPVGEMVRRLMESGVNYAQGFTLNVSNYFGLAANRHYGMELASLIGGNRQFLIDDSRNGLGAPPGNAWCNPAREGLGYPPTTNPDGPEQADLWIKGPAESDGVCGAFRVRAGIFSPAIALHLLKYARWLSQAQRRQLPPSAPLRSPIRVPVG
jgi:endoglucanase